MPGEAIYKKMVKDSRAYNDNIPEDEERRRGLAALPETLRQAARHRRPAKGWRRVSAAPPEGLRDERGFSLIELVITLMVLSILVGIAVASFFFSTKKASDTACMANLRTIRSVIGVYQSENYGANPPDLESLVPDYIGNEKGIRCPVTGEIYEYDSATGEVRCPNCEP